MKNTVETVIKAELFPKSKVPVLLHEIEAVKFPIDGFEAFLCCDGDMILRRQEIFSDIQNNSGLLDRLSQLNEMITELHTFFEKYGDISSNEELIYSLIEMRSFTAAVDYIMDELVPYRTGGKLTSVYLCEFLDSCRELSESEHYLGIKLWLDQLSDTMKNIKSVTFGANLDAQFKVCEIGIVSFDSYPYVSGNFFDNIMRDVTVPDRFKCMVSLGVKETHRIPDKYRMTINRELYTGMNEVFKNILRRVRREIAEKFRNEAAALMSAGEDLGFVVRAAMMLVSITEKGGRLAFPAISEKTYIKSLYDPSLLDKHSIGDIISNTLDMNGDCRVSILTGPNSGGKSVYLNSIAAAQIMFQLGMPVPAMSAEMRIFGHIAALYVKSTTSDNDGRLASESRRLHNCITNASENSLILLDETFSGTSAYDGALLAEQLIKYLGKKGAYAMYVTHFHELTLRITDLNTVGHSFGILCAANDGGRRTYQIEPYDGRYTESSLAKDIVIESGLGFLFDE